MYYLLCYDVVADYLERRDAYREAHLKLAKAATDRGELRLGGALGEPVGAALLFEGDSSKVAESFAQQDPYVINGLVTHWNVRSWTIVGGTGVGAPG